MEQVRVPLVTDLVIEQFNAGQATIKQSGAINAIYAKRSDGTVFATQRPGINIYEDASATVADAAGRGIYYWNAVSSNYFVNNATVYKGSYAAPLAATMTAGTSKVYFFEIGTYLVILDPENNQGWYIAEGASTTLVQITDINFPPKQTPALSLGLGGCVLNGILYVCATNGEIWNSGSLDPTTWSSADFLTAEMKPDNLVGIFEHHEHIAALGTRTIEFFYDNANAVGSPLNVRTDISYEIGMVNYSTDLLHIGDLYFCGQTPAGSIGAYLLSNFQLTKVSKDDLDSLLTSAVMNDGASLVASGFTAGGRNFYHLTPYNINSSVVTPVATFTHDTGGDWGEWELAHTGINNCPVVSWTFATATRFGEGILSNGDLVSVNDSFNPVDTTEAQIYVVAGYVEPGYITDTGSTGVNIPMTIITGQGDSNTLNPKFVDSIMAVCSPTDAAQTLTVYWSNESNNNYNAGRDLDLSNQRNKLNRCGSYTYRNYKLYYAGSEQIEIEGLEMLIV